MAANWKGNQYQRYLLDVMALYRQRPDLKAYMELLLSIATIALFILFAIKPTLITIADLLTKIKSEETTSTLLDTKIKNLGIAQGLFNGQKANIDLLKQAVPDSPEVSSYIRQVEGVIKKDSVVTSTLSVDRVSLTPTTGTASSNLLNENSINVGISTTGSYQNLSSLIVDLENLRRPSILKKVDFNITQLNDLSKILNLSISSSVPYK